MSDTGWVSPGTVAEANLSGAQVTWSDENNIKSSNNSYARAVEIAEYYWDDNVVKLVKGGTISGNDKSTIVDLGTSEITQSYGGSDDLWGETWSVSDINSSSFGVVLSYIAESEYKTNYLKATDFGFSIPTGSTIDGIELEVELKSTWVDDASGTTYAVDVDHVQIKVYYTEGGTPTVGVKYPLPAFTNV